MSYQTRWDGRSGYGGKKSHLWRKVLLLLLGVAMLVFGALEIIIALRDGTNLVGEPKVMVIFGCQVKPEGPSILLRDRLDTALEYLENHPDMTVVVTGGKGDDEHQSEARCMYDYLTAHGVAGETILMEDQARNTWQNANYTLDLLSENGYDTTGDVLLVSSGFHLARIEMLWNRATGNAANISTLDAPVSHFPSAVQMFFREPLALVKSFLFDR